jgi:hypothetical protein
MANKKLRVYAQVPGKTRDLLLRMVKPTLAQVFCQGLTYAYGVTSETSYPTAPVKVLIVGIHRTKRHEALVCSLHGDTQRPDGKLFHITLATAPGVPPAEAGDINMADVEPISPITLDLQFKIEHARVTRPQALERLAA